MNKEAFLGSQTDISSENYEESVWRRKILIVEDDDISSAILCRTLEKDYDTIVASNGEEALERLNSQQESFSLILLDLMMPVMDGYEFLNMIAKDERLSRIPVIVATARNSETDEIRCLESGAVDFVTKPYHPEIVKRRVDGIIHLRETSSISRHEERDRLTGLYSRNYFYIQVERILKKNPNERYDMVVADIENFKVVNERLGIKTGDKVLCYMADRYRRLLGNDGICARLHGDVFAMLVVHGDGSWKDRLLWQWDVTESGIPVPHMVIKYGIYEDVSSEIPPFAMCDRAVMALERIKNLYGKNVAVYNEFLSTELLREQQILDTMEQALAEHQFQVYYQPKYDVHRECVAGAEALVRWIHPEFGYMSPAEFIPLFEQNGFITKLDYYVWREVCETLQRWKKEGRQLIPVSVNISRMDFAVPDLAEWIISLVDRYDVDRELIHLEITETICTEESKHFIRTVSKLRDSGFKIEMDDFGSGYSSLNVLSEMPVDILKLDIKFIQQTSLKKKNILGFVISMAKCLNMETVAEGAETEEQVERLKSFGCDYVQGYYFAKPMPKADFECYLEENAKRTSEGMAKESECLVSAQNTNQQNQETILIVEDNELNRRILKRMIEPYYHVVEASNGKEAYDYLNTNAGEISVILLDMVMPVMDGFQFMKEREKFDKIKKIPVIITSETEEDSELLALRLGAERFVGKPYRSELLLLSIKHAIDRNH